jgi:hypothetical protein
MTHAEYRKLLAKLVSDAETLYYDIGKARNVDVIRELPSDDVIEQLQIILDDAGATALTLRGQVQEAVNEIPTDWR